MAMTFSFITTLRKAATALALSCPLLLGAVPAKPGLIRYANGTADSISVYLRGDEHSHHFTSSDGILLLRAADNTFRYALPQADRLVESAIKASDPVRRSADEIALLGSYDRNKAFSILQEQTASRRAREAQGSSRVAGDPLSGGKARVAQESNLCQFPTIGSPRCVAILVEFADKEFTLENPRQVFDNMLNQTGFNTDGATGSVSDFFTASSNGQFTPQFDVYGPVKLPQNMSYYGGNDAGGNDIRPYEMVPQACAMLDDTVDFSVYDTDGDGMIDNVYVFYAGYGEADGGPANSIWPHSWNLHDDLDLDYYFDGVLLNHYATSNELSNGFGSALAGIGVFCHEFSHVMGLPDLYSTTYTNAFTPGNWSLMDHGSYNNGSHTPPTHTGYERYCLGWVEPHVLENPANVTMYPISQIGNYDDVFMIPTESESEYYILENRQQKSWDAYIPGHGMIVWHIDFVPDIWNMNIVNITKQYIDLVEADNIPSDYTLEGDAFPGTAGVTEFTDDSTPSMRSWAGTALHSPITEIKEQNGVISFMFKGGQDIFSTVVAHDATAIKAGAFTAGWTKVEKASGYLLSVYTLKGNSREYLPGMSRLEVGNTDSYEVTGLTPSTQYYYEVQATNGRFYSASSNTVSVTTLDPTLDYKKPEVLQATNVGEDTFTANWTALDEADFYTVTLLSRRLGKPFTATADFTDKLLPTGWTQSGCSYDARASYAETAPSLKLAGNGSSLTSAIYTSDIRTLSFWYRSTSAAATNSIIVEGLAAGQWKEILKVNPLVTEAGGTTVDIDEIQPGFSQIRLTFEATTGSVCVDNVTVGYGGNYEQLPVDGQSDINVGNATSYTFTGLAPETLYAFRVKAHNDEFTSLESDDQVVKTLTEGGIDNIVTPAGNAVYYNLQGIRMQGRLPAGIYIRVQDGKSSKIIK